MGGSPDRGAGEICVWFCEEKQEFNRHGESSLVFWGVGRAQEHKRRCWRSNRHSHLNEDMFFLGGKLRDCHCARNQRASKFIMLFAKEQ